jgi:hypothetical protein
LFLSALLGSALLGVSNLADWTLGAAAACFWLAISIFLEYFFAGCVRDCAVILGFMVGAAALVGAVAAWYAACAGGRLRDGREGLHPLWDWGQPVSRL